MFQPFDLEIVEEIIDPKSTLVSPDDGSEVDALNPTLTWTVVDTETCNVYLHEDETRVSSYQASARVARDTTETSYTTDTLVAGTTYYWTVIPRNGDVTGECTSGIWEFTVADDASRRRDVC